MGILGREALIQKPTHVGRSMPVLLPNSSTQVVCPLRLAVTKNLRRFPVHPASFFAPGMAPLKNLVTLNQQDALSAARWPARARLNQQFRPLLDCYLRASTTTGPPRQRPLSRSVAFPRLDRVPSAVRRRRQTDRRRCSLALQRSGGWGSRPLPPHLGP